jgi:hypothetical protein
MAKKMKLQPVIYALLGGVASELVSKFVPVGGKYAPAIPVAVGAFMMQGKGEIMQYAGAGMVANGGAKLVTSFIPGLKGIPDADLDTIYNKIMQETDNEISEQVLLGYDPEDGSPVYGSGSISEPVILGTESPVY